MPKRIYFDHHGPIWGFCPEIPEQPELILEFDSYSELVAHCLQAYGQDIEFHEVTPNNWQQLYDAGEFG